MKLNWNIEQELLHFRKIWEYRNPGHNIQHTKELWNERAHEWEKKLQSGERMQRGENRVAATAEYLRARGLLRADDDVIDIGCGPGRFVAEFAKTAHHAVGTDLSGQMLEYGERFARDAGITNTSYVEADFHTADLNALGWRKRFNLVFSSITPAISGNGLRKLMEISRGWCFNSCFVHFEDGLGDELVRNILNREPASSRNAHWHWFYALFNLLLLEGYYPETRYYTETKDVVIRAGEGFEEKWVMRIAEEYNLDPDKLRAPVAEYFKEHADADGCLHRKDSCRYGWVLWNVNDKTTW